MQTTELNPVAPTGTTPDPAKLAEQKQLREAAQQFEALLLNLLLKSMRATVPESTLYGDSSELKMYEELRDEELARAMSARSGLGLAKAIEEQLSQSNGPDPLRALQDAREAGAKARFAVEATPFPRTGR